eukprot:gene10969-11050_t
MRCRFDSDRPHHLFSAAPSSALKAAAKAGPGRIARFSVACPAARRLSSIGRFKNHLPDPDGVQPDRNAAPFASGRIGKVPFSRGDLLTRLLVLVAAASAPAIAVHAYLQSDFNDAASRTVLAEARRSAELLNSDLNGVVESAKQVALILMQDPSVQRFSPDCATPLGIVARAMPRYDMLRVIDEDGTVICSIAPRSPATVEALERRQMELALARGGFEVGAMLTPPGGRGPVLTFNQAFPGQGQRRGVIEIAISARWMQEHLAAFGLPAGAEAVVADRNGIIVAEMPGRDRTGAPVPADLAPLLDAPQSGAVMRHDGDGNARPFGFVPASVLPEGLFTGMALSPVAVASAFEDRQRQAYLLMALGTLVSFGLAMLVGQVFVRRPTNALLDAARRWSLGDFDTRVEVTVARRSEFGRLAHAFNAMAAALSRQRQDAVELMDTLEARVAARTDELLKSRDRLQVAMAQQAKSEASLNQMQKLQAVGQLAGGIAHDFNNLLTAVISALEILRTRLPPEDERSHRLLANALHAADRGGRLTSKLLSFSRRQLLVPVPIDLNAVLLGMVALLTSTLGRKIRVETGLAPALWPALADPNQVESAILNLALNARDAMPDGGTVRISTINVSIPAGPARTSPDGPSSSDAAAGTLTQPSLSGDFVMIRVSDTGIGMTPEILSRAFEPFFTTKKQGRGTGLGLSQVHGLAAQSGGEVRLSSEPGLGTTVSLLLPRAEVDAAGLSSGAASGTARAMGLQVLLVDDDADVRSLTAEMLAGMGHRPLIAASGDAALRMLDDEPETDVLLTDYAMPGMDGLELIARAAHEFPGLRMILMTGHADVDLARQTLRHPVLRKPFTMATLAQVVDSLAIHRDDMEMPMPMPQDAQTAIFETAVPARLDRLPWSRFHWLVVGALGITWSLDGLEVTLVGSLSAAISESPVLRLSPGQIGVAASAYLSGAVVGSLFFGWLTDRLGRKRLFTITLLLYVLATLASGLSWNFWSFALFRFLTGAGIGGEYSAVNATIQELIPARFRGFTDMAVNGSFWLGAAFGAAGSLVVLNPSVMPAEYGWRAAFLIGGALGFGILLLRRFLPESPRWLMTHGRPQDAEDVVDGIEARVRHETGRDLAPVEGPKLRLRTDTRSWFAEGLKALFGLYRRRTLLGLSLMAAQAFCYNAVLFTYALLLTRFYNVPSGRVGLFMLPFAIGNFAGPVLLGRLFDVVGRRPMIAATYAISGVLLIVNGWLFSHGLLDAVTQTAMWMAIFFFASAAASAAYLTVGESFPLEVRAIAIALFYAFGTGVGGVAGPLVFGHLIETGAPGEVFWGYLLAGVLMLGAACMALWIGINAERRGLEDVAPPLSQAV